MLADSEDMSKVRCTCLSRSMPRIAPVFNGAHSNFVVRVFGPNCTSMGGVSYKTESSPITPVKQSLVFLYGMFKPLFKCTLAELPQGCRRAEKEQNYA